MTLAAHLQLSRSRFLVSLLMMELVLGSSFIANSTLPLPGAQRFIAAPGFPTSAFASYYESPALPTREPQPIIYDPVLNFTFPYELTNPDLIPESPDEPVYPQPPVNIPKKEKHALVEAVKANVMTILKSNDPENRCSKCKRVLAAAKPAAVFAPKLVPDALISICKNSNFKSGEACEEQFKPQTFGAIWTQVLALADVNALDGQYICHYLKSDFCEQPKTAPLDISGLFPKPKPAQAQAPKASGERVKVLHMSDFHLDARYGVNTEANCSSGLCCRSDNHNDHSEDHVLLPASPYGAFKCDTPYDLGLAALQAVGALTGTGKGCEQEPLAWTLYTGDLASHDPQSQMSREYLEYVETSTFDMFKTYLSGPVFCALGNHDASPENIDSPHILPGRLGEQSSWNYQHLAGLWQHEGWISPEAAEEARTHYAGYSIKTHYGLRIISFNTDFWYKSNILNMINTTNPDNSGVFSWMINELQTAEDEKERVWIMGHVPSGWDGVNPIPDPTNLFYQIMDRYSPHVIANIFFGHNHEDQFMIFYANNGTVQNAENALVTGWLGPSVTPLTNMNSGFRLYEIDTGDFNIYEAYTFFSNVSDYASLRETGPIFQLEYSTRETYGAAADWDENAPLNATFWHRVTEAMENDLDLVTLHNFLQGKMSVKSPECITAACQKAKICYMRSGSVALGAQCPQGQVPKHEIISSLLCSTSLTQ
ncbi:hypothetical protein N7462_006578 [Penicillium macrosclerotiorum]|uniref:uncharacterized protein n=1 Tax=Penicillium macrosclerotiorum TaxID=303699 RepID=UPI0025487298|nr:uncharacterized protein N7462_006578 [Penicillium macrosclerotiorum]KAJ5683413.1 hypothetical protein N7462_006578 [Penicillium macrosclerotiorum]